MQPSRTEHPSDEHDDSFDAACWDPAHSADDAFVAAMEAKLAPCRHRAVPARRRLALAAIVLTAAAAAAAWLVLSFAQTSTPRADGSTAAPRPLAVDEGAPPAATDDDRRADTAGDYPSTR